MRLSVAVLRNPEAERRAKELAEAPTVKTEEQHRRDEAAQEKARTEPSPRGPRVATAIQSVWKRKFRPLPEAKAADLFADVLGDAFVLGVAGALIIYEYWKASQKPDINKERIDDLERRFEELRIKEDELAAAEERQQRKFEALEEALRAVRDTKMEAPPLRTQPET